MSMFRFARLFRNVGFIAIMAAAGLVASGCKTTSDAQFSQLPGIEGSVAAAPSPAISAAPGAAPAAPAAEEPGTNPDVIHANDALTITFTDLPYPQPPIEDRVKQDGTITLIQNQTFQAAGKTRGDLEKEIRSTYVPKIFKTMTVTVKKTEQTQFFYVGGEVKQPGRQVYISRITVLKAIQSAGDFTDFASKKKVRLTRANGVQHTVNCVKAQENPELDLEVFPGDKIWVPRRLF